MPIKKAAMKALRQSKKRALHNQEIKNNISYLRRMVLKFIGAKNREKAQEYANKLLKAYDKAAQKGIIKKNTRDRSKSRIMKKFKALK